MIASEIIKKLWTRKSLIALFMSVALLLCYFGLFMCQSYTATVYVKYTENNVVNGKASNGEKIDPYEIAQPYVVIKALEQMGVETNNVTDISQRITITPIVSKAEQDKYASWIDEFSDYKNTEENKPTPIYYRVEFSTNEGTQFAKNFLSALVHQYRSYYTEKYDGFYDVSAIPESVILDSDYYQAVNKLQINVKETVRYLNNIATSDVDFRSSTTGYSINDLIDLFRQLIETEIAPTTQYILDTGVSKDAATLIASLRQSSDTAQRESDENLLKASTQKQLMELYAEKNKEYVSTIIDPDNYDNQVRVDVERDNAYVQNMTTYDQLMLDYVDYAVNSENLLIDKSYINESLSKFGNITSGAEAPIEKIANIYDQYAFLMDITEHTLDGYNEFRCSRVLLQASGVQISENLPELIYYTISLILAFCLGCGYIITQEFMKRRESNANEEAKQ
ncbi:MAG: hypothetical protein E7633_03690 [Ruminococcaceae bacterium]|nr:hypothetical protein [Oscillospiraceae bacterium]